MNQDSEVFPGAVDAEAVAVRGSQQTGALAVARAETEKTDPKMGDALPESLSGHTRAGRKTTLDSGVIRWADGSRVSFLNKLFGRHPEAGVGTSSQFISWAGQSGHGYQYEIHPIQTALKALPGNYIYARQSEDGSWVPIYIAQTRDLHQRLEGHVTLEDAIANGATHIHIHYSTAGQAARCTEERDLILNWHPACNDAVES